jgi:hypothetical protein
MDHVVAPARSNPAGGIDCLDSQVRTVAASAQRPAQDYSEFSFLGATSGAILALARASQLA